MPFCRAFGRCVFSQFEFLTEPKQNNDKTNAFFHMRKLVLVEKVKEVCDCPFEEDDV